MPGKSLENMHVAVLAGGHSAELTRTFAFPAVTGLYLYGS